MQYGSSPRHPYSSSVLNVMENVTLSPIDGLGSDSAIASAMRSAVEDNSTATNNDRVVLFNRVEAGSVSIETAEGDKSKRDCACALTYPVIKIKLNKKTINNQVNI